MYIDKLEDVVNKCNNTYHITIKMKSVVKLSKDIDFWKENNKKGPKFKVDDNVRISKYKKLFAKGYVASWSEEMFMIKIEQKNVLWTYVISDLNGKGIAETFYEKELQKTNQRESRVEKVIKRNYDKLYVK